MNFLGIQINVEAATEFAQNVVQAGTNVITNGQQMQAVAQSFDELKARPEYQALLQNQPMVDMLEARGINISGESVDLLQTAANVTPEQLAQTQATLDYLNANPQVMESLNGLNPELLGQVMDKFNDLQAKQEFQDLQAMVAADPDLAQTLEALGIPASDLTAGTGGPAAYLSFLEGKTDQDLTALNGTLDMALSDGGTSAMQFVTQHPQLASSFGNIFSGMAGFSADGLGNMFQNGNFSLDGMGFDFGKIMEGFQGLMQFIMDFFSNGGMEQLMSGIGGMFGQIGNALNEGLDSQAVGNDFGQLITSLTGQAPTNVAGPDGTAPVPANGTAPVTPNNEQPAPVVP